VSQERDRLNDRQHRAVAVLSLWLVLTSPWIAMLGRIPAGADWLDYLHVAVGFVVLLLAVTYAWSCTRGGRWRLYFPLTHGQFRSVGHDLAGLLRGRVPAAEGGGLFGCIEGLLLVALVATAVTGAAWFLTQGSSDALAWRGHHVWAARTLIGLLVLHVVTVSLHLLDFVRG
jgi:cytochrome b561